MQAHALAAQYVDECQVLGREIDQKEIATDAIEILSSLQFLYPTTAGLREKHSLQLQRTPYNVQLAAARRAARGKTFRSSRTLESHGVRIVGAAALAIELMSRRGVVNKGLAAIFAKEFRAVVTYLASFPGRHFRATQVGRVIDRMTNPPMRDFPLGNIVKIKGFSVLIANYDDAIRILNFRVIDSELYEPSH